MNVALNYGEKVPIFNCDLKVVPRVSESGITEEEEGQSDDSLNYLDAIEDQIRGSIKRSSNSSSSSSSIGMDRNWMSSRVVVSEAESPIKRAVSC